MLAVRAVSDYCALADDQIDVKEGQLFYVLSTTADGRKYYLSTSSRVPFSRFARAGYAPVPLFTVIGNTLPPAERAKVRMMISNSRAPQQARPKAESGKAADDRVGGVPPAASEPRVGITRNISAAARYWLGGMTSRASQDAQSGDTAVASDGCAVRSSSTGDDSSQAPIGSAANRYPPPSKMVVCAERGQGSSSDPYRSMGSALNAPVTSSDRRYSVDAGFLPPRKGSVDSAFAPSRKGSIYPEPLEPLVEVCGSATAANATDDSSLSQKASTPRDVTLQPLAEDSAHYTTVNAGGRVPSKASMVQTDVPLQTMTVQGGDSAAAPGDDASLADDTPNRSGSGIAGKLTRGLERIGSISLSSRRELAAIGQKASQRFVQYI